MKRTEATDFTWLAFLSGDQNAFTRIYQHYTPSLMAYGAKFVSDEQVIDDAVQDVYIELYVKRARLGPSIKNLKAYLFASLKNALLKKLRKQKNFPTLSLDSLILPDFSIEYDIQNQLIDAEISQERSARMQKATSNLSPKQKEIIYLKFEEELAYNEISDVMKISIESARKQLYRALTSLREQLNHEDFIHLYSCFIRKEN